MTKLSTSMRIRTAFSFVAGVGIFFAILFWPAGRLDWREGWVYMAVVGINFTINYFYIRRVNPGLIEARLRVGEGTKRWDLVWSALFSPFFVAVYVVAGLDAVRYGWSSMTLAWWPLGAAVFLAGTSIFTWSMAVNPFFEKTVRIQTDRGHRVIDTGPYAYVRHPGYVGFFAWIVSPPLLLRSWWAFLPAALSVLGLVVRTALEDRTLRRELEGYEEYTRRVRSRLVPGIW